MNEKLATYEIIDKKLSERQIQLVFELKTEYIEILRTELALIRVVRNCIRNY